MNRIKELKNDITSGKIYGLKLVKVTNDIIRNNIYAEVFNVTRKITRFDDDCFYLKTHCYNTTTHYDKVDGAYRLANIIQPTNEWYEEAEAYYNAFTYYDDEVLIVDNEYDTVIYEVVHSY